jgi:hypothetical protein
VRKFPSNLEGRQARFTKVGFVIVYGKQATNPWSRCFLEKLIDAILTASDNKTIKGLGAETTYCKENTD